MHAQQRQVWKRQTLAIFCGMLAGVTTQAAVNFSFSDNFNGYTPGAYEIPTGWVTQDARTVFYPVVTFEDPPAWITIVAPPGGIVDYDIPWSGGGRLTLIHPFETTTGEYREVSAWYEGKGELNYPLDLTSSSLKAQFDVITRTGTNGDCRADGLVFAVQPTLGDLVTATSLIGRGGGALGWQDIPGFSIEFDLFGGSSDPDGRNHVGLNVALNSDPGGEITSLVVGELDNFPNMVTVGDNNQQISFTVFYNDPNEGGAGVVRVYAKVDPNTADTNVVDPNDVVSYGVDPGDPNTTPYGRLVLEGCIGAFDYSEAIFGFTASTAGCDAVLQVDNVVVTTDDQGGEIGAACPDPNITLSTGIPVTLAVGPADSCAGNLTSPGWDVKTYKPAGFGIDQFKASTALGAIAEVSGEPDLNYDDGSNGCPGAAEDNRLYPGISAGDNGFGIVATGWICFPSAGDYLVDVRSADGFEWVIGEDLNTQLIASFDGSRGCDSTTRIALTVPQAGVYPTRLLQFDGFANAGLEFAWIETPTSQFLPQKAQLIGAGAGLPGEPLVYGRLNGNPVEAGISVPPVVNVSPTQKVAGTGTGTSGFEIKTVISPEEIAIIHSRDADGNFTARKLLDLMDDLAGAATEDVVNFVDDTTDLGLITGDVSFPGISQQNSFAARAEGFATFDQPGFYTLWLDWDDQAWLQIGQQVIFAATSEGSTFVTLNISEAGTYPIRVEMLEFVGGASLELGEHLPGGEVAPVNSPSSSITVHTAATSGAYDWGTRADVITADRKVAAVGQGSLAGWNAKLTKSVDLGGGFVLGVDKVGVATMLTENNHRDIPLNSFPSTALSLDYLDLTDVGEVPNGDRFSINDTFGLFTPTADSSGGNDNLAISATGYIEFPAAGHYGLGVNSDDGCVVWVAGKIVSVQPFGSGPSDSNVGVVYVEEAGLYNIRVDYFENTGGASLEIFQYKPDSSVALINSVDADVTVYRALNATPSNTKYANPTLVPASAVAAEYGSGDQRGVRTQIVERSFVSGDGDASTGGDLFRDFAQLSELLAGAIDGAASLSQPGVLAVDQVVPGEVQWWTLGDYPGSGSFNGDDFGVRLTGYLELTTGGYLLDVNSDNGFQFWIGGDNPKVDGWQVGASGSLKGNVGVPLYFTVEADGLYKFVLEHMERDGLENLGWFELPIVGGVISSAPLNGEASSIKSYVSLQTCDDPAADTDADGDVDMADYEVLAGCVGSAPVGACYCLDLNGDEAIDVFDLDQFVDCMAGPGVAASCVP